MASSERGTDIIEGPTPGLVPVDANASGLLRPLKSYRLMLK